MAASYSGRYLEMKPTAAGLYVTLTQAGREELAELREQHPDWRDDELFAYLFEDFAANGWQLLDPSEIGLTSCRIGISPDATPTPEGMETVYWHERYQIEDAAEQLESGELFLMLAKGE